MINERIRKVKRKGKLYPYSCFSKHSLDISLATNDDLFSTLGDGAVVAWRPHLATTTTVSSQHCL